MLQLCNFNISDIYKLLQEVRLCRPIGLLSWCRGMLRYMLHGHQGGAYDQMVKTPTNEPNHSLLERVTASVAPLALRSFRCDAFQFPLVSSFANVPYDSLQQPVQCNIVLAMTPSLLAEPAVDRAQNGEQHTGREC